MRNDDTTPALVPAYLRDDQPEPEADGPEAPESLIGLNVACLLIVAITSPFNLVLQGLFVWRLLAALFGTPFANDSGGLLLLLAMIAHTGWFALLWLVVTYASSDWSPLARRFVTIATTAFYVLFWLGWTLIAICRCDA